MRTQSINRADAEKMWGVFRNVSGGVLSNGCAAHLTTNASSADGNAVTGSFTGGGALLVGVCDEDIADNDYGFVQTYGYKDSIFVSATAAASSLRAQGDIFGPGATVSANGFAHGGTVDNLGPIVNMSATASGTGEAVIAGLIKCM